MRIKELGEEAWNPVRYGARFQGFDPAYGRYLLSGSQMQDPFYQFLGGTTQGSLPDVDLERAWREMVAVSGSGGKPAEWGAYDPQQQGRMLTYQALLGPTAEAGKRKRDAIIMAATVMGAGQGYGATALKRGLGGMYDVFSSQAASRGELPTGFISWLNQQMLPGSMPGTTVAPWSDTGWIDEEDRF
jgi:hypothetical protein